MPMPLHSPPPDTAAVSVNPATGVEIERYAYAGEAAVERALEQTTRAYGEWRRMPMAQRAERLRAMAGVLRRQARPYAELITREMGKRIGEAAAEIEKCAGLCDWYAEHGPALLADEPVALEKAHGHVSYLPMGVVLGIMPWNFPFWQALRAAVPILLGGNGFVLKHAQNVMGCAYALETAWREAGLPEGLFTALNVPRDRAEALVADARIAAVTLTGSPGAGSAVAAAAGRVRKKSVLELGGSDPFIVLADADIAGAVDAAIAARYANTGQVCIAAKRFLLEAPIAAAFTEQFLAKARALKPGDPMLATTTLAPLARDDLRAQLDTQVQTTLKQGATLLCGGACVDGPGWFYQPTVLAGVAPGMAAFDEETFGPVAALTVVRDAEEAVALANRSKYGLSSNLWTRDIARAVQLARRLETGGVYINGFSASNPRTPIGGVKDSGYGRELSHFGIREFVNAQAVVIAGA